MPDNDTDKRREAQPFEASTEFEAQVMLETAALLHNRLVEQIDRLPWWRFRARAGMCHALMVTGGACFEFAEDADRLAELDPEGPRS